MTGRSVVALATAAAAGGALAWGLATMSQEPAFGVGRAAPAIALEDLAGQPASLSHYAGRVVLLDFWATWCDNCREELPELKRLHAAYAPRGLEILGVSLDAGGRREAAPFAAEHAIPWRILLGDGRSASAYGVRGLPAKVLVASDGTVAASYAGPTPPERLEAQILRLLAEKEKNRT